jgi:Fe-S cluster assembly iron-binding protein IscA
VEKGEFPVQLTERSAAEIRRHIRANPEIPRTACVRVLISGDRLSIDLVAQADTTTDIVGESFGLSVAVPRADVARLFGAVVDFRSVGPEVGFVIRDPRGVHSRASDPGGLMLSEAKLRTLHPELFAGERRGLLRWVMGNRPDPGVQEISEALTEHLNRGDSRAAVVVSVAPLVVAAYTDELDCVALLRFPDALVAEHRLRVGSRLLTVNMYAPRAKEAVAADLVPGPKDTGQFANYVPLIADFLATDPGRAARRKQSIDEEEWQRTEDMGTQRLGQGVTPRDGRPLYCGSPATTA